MGPPKSAIEIATDHELRGLTYFGMMTDVYKWTEASVDPLQKSNTPLLKRPPRSASGEEAKTSNILILDDHGNGSHKNGYDGCQGAIVQEEVYIIEQRQCVEAFNYFTHHRVVTPPPTRINTGHRNGSLVLGTFIIEMGNNEPHPETTEILRKKGNKYVLVEVLTRMAACYGFDGWLLNIGSPF